MSFIFFITTPVIYASSSMSVKSEVGITFSEKEDMPGSTNAENLSENTINKQKLPQTSEDPNKYFILGAVLVLITVVYWHKENTTS